MGLFDKKKKPVKLTPGEARKEEVDQFMHRYKEKLRKSLARQIPGVKEQETEIKPVRTQEYQEFKKQYMSKPMNWYEKSCKFSEKLLKVKPSEKKIPDYEEAIKICHLDITPTGAASFAIVMPMLVAVIGALLGYALLQSIFFVMFFLFVGAMMMGPLQNLPMFLANSWRMKASNQMVLCIFYVVTYMRHTSNLELAVEFAADHLVPPLSLDLRKVLWDVETEKFESVKESLDSYLITWKKWNMEFVEAFHLIESSLYEGDEERRIGMLEKSLSVMLEETYEKMLHYAQNLKSPITMLHMLGVILPILGLVILPLVVSFMCEVKWYHLIALYNFALPIGVYYLTKKILSTRPTGYGDTDISEENPDLKKYKKILIKLGKKEIKIEPLYVAIIIGATLIFLGLIPLILHVVTLDSNFDVIYKDDKWTTTTSLADSEKASYAFLGYKESMGCKNEGVGDAIGPYGLGASLLSLSIILGLGISIGIYYKLKSKKVIKIRDRSKELEQEFAAGLFQLGNRLGDGLPPEIAFTKVARTMEGTVSGDFFRKVASNISRLGMGVDEAIFNPQYGALVYYPSNLIESSMKVLTESAKKGPRIAAQAIINVSRYIKEIHRVNERLKDLMADIVSSMRSQIKFLTPVISAIVIGITSMIVTILGKLGVQMREVAKGGEASTGGSLLQLFGDSVPPYYFQIMVGIYVVQIIYILTLMTNGIENGSDKLKEKYDLGTNLTRSTFLYVLLSLIIILLFNILAVKILPVALS